MTFAIVYDLRDPEAGIKAHRDRKLWGRLYTDIYTLDTDHVVLVFRAGPERWSAWEAVRREWILGSAS